MAQKITFTTPDTQPSFASCTAQSATIDLTTGEVSLSVCMCDGSGNPVKSLAATFTLDGSALVDLSDELLADAQAAGQLPAGSIS